MLQSPILNQFNLDRYFHIAFSLSSQQLSSTLVSLRLLFVFRDEGCNSSHSNCFCNGKIFFPTCPKTFSFQASNFDLHSSKQHTIEKSKLEVSSLFQASKTTCSHQASFNHMDSNQKRFFRFFFFGLCRKDNSKGL